MPVDSFAAGDLFRVTIIKHHSLNPSDQWANTYELQSSDSGLKANLSEAANKLLLWERNMMFASTVFDRLVVGTWEPDSAPYNPINFFTTTLGLAGLKTTPAAPKDLTTCLHITRNVAYGRVGHIFLRNCLGEGDVEAPAGKAVLTDQGGQAVSEGLAEVAANLTDMFGNPAIDVLGLVMVDKTADVVRPLISFIVSGVSQVKSDHKWYNRTGSP